MRMMMGLALCVVSAGCLPPEVAAATPKQQAAAPAAKGQQPDAASATKALDAGIKAYEAGRNEQAVQLLGSALSGGNLQGSQMARALYVRGLAHRKVGKPALAISDLTSAMWLKGGLTDAERADAAEARASAYREAGVVDTAPQQRVAAAPAPVAPVAALSPAVQAPRAVIAATSSAPVARSAQAQAPAPSLPWTAAATTAAPAARTATPSTAQPAAVAAVTPQPAPEAEAPSSLWSWLAPPATTGAVTPAAAPAPAGTQRVATAAPAPGPAARQAQAAPAPVTGERAAATAASPSSTNVFESVFGNLSLGPDTTERPAVRVAAAPAATEPTAAQWNGQPSTTVRAAPTGKAAQTAALTAPARAAATPEPAAPAGGYSLQITTAKSRQEATAIAAKFKAQHARVMRARALDIEEITGATGTVHRIKLGPYANANEGRNLCVRLRQKGYDCQLLTP